MRLRKSHNQKRRNKVDAGTRDISHPLHVMRNRHIQHLQKKIQEEPLDLESTRKMSSLLDTVKSVLAERNKNDKKKGKAGGYVETKDEKKREKEEEERYVQANEAAELDDDAKNYRNWDKMYGEKQRKSVQTAIDSRRKQIAKAWEKKREGKKVEMPTQRDRRLLKVGGGAKRSGRPQGRMKNATRDAINHVYAPKGYKPKVIEVKDKRPIQQDKYLLGDYSMPGKKKGS